MKAMIAAALLAVFGYFAYPYVANSAPAIAHKPAAPPVYYITLRQGEYQYAEVIFESRQACEKETLAYVWLGQPIGATCHTQSVLAKIPTCTVTGKEVTSMEPVIMIYGYTCIQ